MVKRDIRIKRVYEPAEAADGTRVLVERLWPRGVRKADATLDLWLKDIAPSPELRRWYKSAPDAWQEFERRYRAELEANPDAIDRLLAAAPKGRLTLVYAKRDEAHNSAAVLKRYLDEVGGRSRS